MTSISPLKPTQASQFLSLYEQSFPPEERRHYQSADQLMDFVADHRPTFRILAVSADNCSRLAGFITFWEFPDYVYIEHLAVDPILRGSGIGSEMIRYIARTHDSPLILEVEPAETGAMAQRRIKFYQRLGFDLHDEINYMQPPYHPELQPIPLSLMTLGDIDLTNPAAALDPIYRHVYKNL